MATPMAAPDIHRVEAEVVAEAVEARDGSRSSMWQLEPISPMVSNSKPGGDDLARSSV